VRFLSELGRTPDFSVGTERVARTWRVAAKNEAASNRFYTEGMQSFTHPDIQWVPMYSTVKGDLPIGDLPRQKHHYWNTEYSYAQCRVEVQTAGKVELLLNTNEGKRVWVNDKEIHLQDNGIRFDAEPGVYTVTLLIDYYDKREDIRLSLGEGTAQANFVQGR